MGLKSGQVTDNFTADSPKPGKTERKTSDRFPLRPFSCFPPLLVDGAGEDCHYVSLPSLRLHPPSSPCLCNTIGEWRLLLRKQQPLRKKKVSAVEGEGMREEERRGGSDVGREEEEEREAGNGGGGGVRGRPADRITPTSGRPPRRGDTGSALARSGASRGEEQAAPAAALPSQPDCPSPAGAVFFPAVGKRERWARELHQTIPSLVSPQRCGRNDRVRPP
ncbi:hypothetical protein FQA47_002236 [Oryzias melastigma]|uniref:Uncharacterized protein n=1 Tax=Oryzias melastigma TaxID=30732 RepID=A0A834CAK0_ORYME|nr:hypothetical protein FQA47_002236 [Oryzias melastigma]